jgi:hypothetical protein
MPQATYLGRYVRALRGDRPQHVIAAAAGLTQPFISHLERGRRFGGPLTLLAVAGALSPDPLERYALTALLAFDQASASMTV